MEVPGYGWKNREEGNLLGLNGDVSFGNTAFIVEINKIGVATIVNIVHREVPAAAIRQTIE